MKKVEQSKQKITIEMTHKELQSLNKVLRDGIVDKNYDKYTFKTIIKLFDIYKK